MRARVVVFLVAASLAGRARAQAAPGAAEQGEIRRVISAQIEAFRHDDGDAAIRFAAPNIKARFGDGPHFLAMVRQVYPSVYRPRSFQFLSLTPDHAVMVQKVALIGPDGVPALALYSMEHEADGSWRIAGCSLIEAADTAI